MKFHLPAATALVCLSSLATAAIAQNTNSGDIRGVVTDTTGAIVPGANVEVKDVDKGEVHNYTTDGAGLYDTGSIIPDHYLITVTKSGFEAYVRGPINLDVATVTINAALQVGTSSQQVVVNTDVPQLETETGAQSATLDSKQLLQLPQVGADWENFVTLLPGASSVIEGGRTRSGCIHQWQPALQRGAGRWRNHDTAHEPEFGCNGARYCFGSQNQRLCLFCAVRHRRRLLQPD